ncbi:hypothetical protein APHMUC_1100 [Anaplasma phagocytophilum str. ApMUC09]|uniref:Uncharacterized protein n=1 Tax=Anaplasma phagocytophilum str. ApMUC09 TaxID=1359152 RepID=A0A0F3NAX0_ANAPH|nr:hypothetical protein APHMUC_1100 [Anaplasma phagocytophilum str. ApMUC09]
MGRFFYLCKNLKQATNASSILNSGYYCFLTGLYTAAVYYTDIL